MLLYASCITNLTDARYFAAREVDFLGFNLEAGTPGYLDPIYMKAMREWVEGPRIVGEFRTTPTPQVQEAAAFYGLDAVLLWGETPLSALPALEGCVVLLQADTNAGPEELALFFHQAKPWVAFFVLHFSEKNMSDTAGASAWKNLFAQYPTLLQLDAAPETLPDLIAQLQPAGLLLRGGEEEQVGVKSFDEIEAIFDML